MASLPLTFCFLFFFLSSLSLSSHSQPHHFNLHNPESELPEEPDLEESFELTQPLPTDNLPVPPLECTLSLNYGYNETEGQPPITFTYSPPSDCPAPWSYTVLTLSGAVSGEISDQIGSVWLAGVELLRTSTPQPNGNGTFWNVSKDITRYSSVLNSSGVPITIMLKTLVTGELDGCYDVSLNLRISYYKDSTAVWFGNRKLGLGLGLGLGLEGFEGNGVYDEPADLVIPVGSGGDEVNWFSIVDESNVGSKSIMIPMNARKVVLELFVSSHGDDEFWYSNPPNTYILANNLSTSRGNGAFREVFVKIDGNVVATEVPFPVVYTGGINPLFWQPVVAIGAYDLPSYDFDLSTVLGALLDCKSHSFEIGVTNAIKYWLVDANLHVWLDTESAVVQADVGVVKPAEVKQSFDYDFNQLDGSFQIEVERKSKSLGWVASSYGNFTTSIEKKIKFKNKIKYEQNGAYKIVKQKIKVKTEVKVVSETGSTISESKLKRKYPLTLTISILPGADIDTHLMITNLSHSLEDEFSNGKSVSNTQDAGGWVLLKDHTVHSGVADTQQNLAYCGSSGCSTRSVQASNGKLVRYDSNYTGNSLFKKMLNALLEIW